jgi:hypothetical protein
MGVDLIFEAELNEEMYYPRLFRRLGGSLSGGDTDLAIATNGQYFLLASY